MPVAVAKLIQLPRSIAEANVVPLKLRFRAGRRLARVQDVVHVKAPRT